MEVRAKSTTYLHVLILQEIYTALLKVQEKYKLKNVNSDTFANVQAIALTIAVKHALQLKSIILDSEQAQSKQTWASLKSRLNSCEGRNSSLIMASNVLSEVLDEELERIWGESKSVFGTPKPLQAAAVASSSCSGPIRSLSDSFSAHTGLLFESLHRWR